MALLLEDCAIATSFVTVATEHSLGAIWLRKDKRTPNYPSLGLLHGYKLGDNGSLHRLPNAGLWCDDKRTPNYPSFGLLLWLQAWPLASRIQTETFVRAVSWVRLMALRLEDHATATSFVTVKTVHSLGAIWLRKDKRTPNYPSLGLLHGYKLGDKGSLSNPMCRLVAQ
jgi:hypothetical protein